MAKPQQQELRRSGRVPALDPDATEAARSADGPLGASDTNAPIPEDQRPGHHPEHDQDKPDMDAFAERLGVTGDESGERAAATAHAGTAAEDDHWSRPGWLRLALTMLGTGLVAAVIGGVIALIRRIFGLGKS